MHQLYMRRRVTLVRPRRRHRRTAVAVVLVLVFSVLMAGLLIPLKPLVSPQWWTILGLNPEPHLVVLPPLGMAHGALPQRALRPTRLRQEE